MKSYFVFVLVLTVAYIIYYAVIIVQDLYGKKGTGGTDEEVFGLGILDDEQSVDVTESETGFSIGVEKYETEIAPIASSETEEEAAADKREAATAEKLERLKAKAEERMEETVPYLSDARTAEELYKAMVSKGRAAGRPEMVWNPLKDRL